VLPRLRQRPRVVAVALLLLSKARLQRLSPRQKQADAVVAARRIRPQPLSNPRRSLLRM
jgi:hypothetical protein